MRLPRHVLICGKRYTVTADPEHDGGRADTATRRIEVGTMDPAEVPENLLHEIGEAILMERDFRYVPEKEELENSDYRFFLTHADWQLFCKDMAIALSGVSFRQITRRKPK